MTDMVPSRAADLELAASLSPVARSNGAGGTEVYPGWEAVPGGAGAHRLALLQITRFFRTRLGYTTQRAVEFAQLLISAGALEGYNPADPFTTAELARMADLQLGYSATLDDEEVAEEELAAPLIGDDPGAVSRLGTLEDLPPFGVSVRQWLIYRYIPEAVLVMLYGDGKVGKTTFAAYVASLALRRGKNVLFVGAGEETPAMFAAKLYASRGQRSPDDGRFFFDRVGGLRFPSGKAALRDALQQAEIGFVYFDAWRSHIERTDGGGHEADLTRTVLTPLSELAEELGVTVLCTTHENAAGNLLGSSEVKNVCRSTLHVQRDQRGQRTVRVKWTNLPEPTGFLRFAIESTPLVDFRTGAHERELLEDGEVADVSVGFVRTVEIKAVEEVDVDSVTDPAQNAAVSP